MKAIFLPNQQEDSRRLVFAVAVFLFYLFYLFAHVNIYLFMSLRETWVVALLPVLVAAGLYFFRYRDCFEQRLLIWFFLWFVLSRMLNGDVALTADFWTLFHVSLMLPVLSLGLCLKREERKLFLKVLSAVVGGFYFVVGLLCIYAFILRTEILNPLSQQFICGMQLPIGFDRMNVMDMNPDTTAAWFMSAFLLMLYQFFACDKKVWRFPIVLAGLVHYIVMAMIYTRSVLVCMAVVLGLLFTLAVWRALKKRAIVRLWSVILAGAVFAVVFLVAYSSFNGIYQGFGRASIAIRFPDSTAEEKAEYYVRDYTNPKKLVGEDMDEVSTGRTLIYKASVDILKEKPILLTRGCPEADCDSLLTDYAQERGIIEENQIVPHFQNYLLQVLMLTGLPGFLLVFAMSLLLVIKCVRFFFADDADASMAARVLVFPVTASMLYGMFEACFFTITDIRTLYFFLMSGIFLGFYRDKLTMCGYRSA